MSDEPTGKTSPLVVNQSGSLPPWPFRHCSAYPWSRTCTSMPPGGSEFFFKPVRTFSGAHRKMPLLPPSRRCRHWATISKLVYGLLDFVTPTGVPLHFTPSSPQVHVSSSVLTL